MTSPGPAFLEELFPARDAINAALPSEQIVTPRGKHTVVNASVYAGHDLVIGGNIRIASAGEKLFLYLPDTIIELTPTGPGAIVTVITTPDRAVARVRSDPDRQEPPLVSVGQGDSRVDTFPEDL